MKVISEISLRDFKFWSGGEDRAKNCTDEQLDKIESIMESDAPESGWTDDDINNFFWFDFDTIADWLGYKDEKHFDAGVREDDRFKVRGLFGTPDRLVTNCCYTTKGIAYFARITPLKFNDLSETIAETFKAYDRYRQYRREQENDE